MCKDFNSNKQQWKFLCTVQNIQIEINFQLWNIRLVCTLSVERPETSVEVCGLIHSAEKEKSLKTILSKIAKGQTIVHTSLKSSKQFTFEGLVFCTLFGYLHFGLHYRVEDILNNIWLAFLL